MENDIVKGTLKNGFKFRIPRDRFGKWKMLKLLKNTKTDPSLVADVVDLLLGDQAEAFVDSFGEDPSVDDVSRGLTEIFEAARFSGDPEVKKS
ncbi:MAG: hypothetical protein IIZ05_00530 [Firmicutes bacterium]|nr:hypothetical protein [Bacillota bacterium]